MSKRCGYIALLGRPNAGKSTLLNSLVGDKVAVVSRKPQTTRNRILGVVMAGDAQVLVLDTPGVHRDEGLGLLNEKMNKVAMRVAKEGDLIVYLVDPKAGFTSEDSTFFKRILEATTASFLIVMTKGDSLKGAEMATLHNDLGRQLEEFFSNSGHPEWIERCHSDHVLEVSAKRPEEVKKLKAYLAAAMPEGPWMFPEDDLTDMPRNFIVGELIREQIFRQLSQELPYQTAVKVLELKMKKDMVVVVAEVIVERNSQKGIVVGEGGRQIKAIGTFAREALEKHFGQKVFLDLRVAVNEGWTSDARLMAELTHLGGET